MNTETTKHLEDTRALTEFYQYISAMGKVAMSEKRAAGETMHLAPLGYKNARDEQGRSVIVPDQETFELVKEARRLREQGLSIRKVCKVIGTKGLRSQRGKIIGPSSMFRILSSLYPTNE